MTMRDSVTIALKQYMRFL